MLKNYQSICPNCGSWFIQTVPPKNAPVKEQELQFECTDCGDKWEVKKPIWLQKRVKENKLIKERK